MWPMILSGHRFGWPAVIVAGQFGGTDFAMQAGAGIRVDASTARVKDTGRC
jgi:hypothetical protein